MVSMKQSYQDMSCFVNMVFWKPLSQLRFSVYWEQETGETSEEMLLCLIRQPNGQKTMTIWGR